MVFSSLIFIFYFLPFFFLAYYAAGKKLKNDIILLGSILFYAWGAPRFIFVILGTTLVDFYIVRWMWKAEGGTKKKLLMGLSLFINLGLLAYFKYANFFVENVNALFAQVGFKQFEWVSVVLPIGISFYTFETVTYVMDVYRGAHEPFRRFRDYQLYIILFPKLIAGPIIRYRDFAAQIYDHTSFDDAENRLGGLYRFFIGLGKKVLIANVIGAAADKIFAIPHSQLGTATAWLGMLSYTFQIYFDFSGYSDMAIGLGRMMGFRFPENFNNPYTADSISDFWRRWHMTLGAWMRNYLYIPLGGNRVNSKSRLYLNLWLVFLASGLWHGAAWGYIIWGAYHGLFIVAERTFLGKWLKKAGRFAVLYSFAVVSIGWVFFKLENFGAALRYFQRMFSMHPDTNLWRPDSEFFPILAIAALFSFCTLSRPGRWLQQKVFYEPFSIPGHFAMAFVSLMLCIITAGYLTISTFNPFIYFRF